jgi:hypothetical protein
VVDTQHRHLALVDGGVPAGRVVYLVDHEQSRPILNFLFLK